MILSEKLQIVNRLQERRKAQLEDSFYLFVSDAFEVLHPGEKLSGNWHIRYICDLLEQEIERIVKGEKKSRDIIINVPPRSLKSFITTVCLPAWGWVKDARLKFIGSSYSSDLSIEHNVASRRLVESEWYKRYWSNKVVIASDQNQKSKFETTKNGVRRATSTGGTITGSGADVVIVDDPVNPQLASSEVDRKTANKHFDETLSTRLNNPDVGLFIVIMQRLHEEDLTGHLLKKNPEAYTHICIPAEVSDNIKPTYLIEHYRDGLFFPSRFTVEVLASLRTALGSYGYAGQYGQLPSPAEGGIIKKAWFKVISYNEFQERIRSKNIDNNVFVDGAYTADKKNDPSALMANVYCEHCLYILDSTPVHKELPQLIEFTKSYKTKHSVKNQNIAVRIEPKASGKSLKQVLVNEGVNAIELPPPTDDKVARVNNCTPFLEAGRCYLVDGSWIDGFLGECAAFPNGAHDDQVDNLANSIAYYTINRIVPATRGGRYGYDITTNQVYSR